MMSAITPLTTHTIDCQCEGLEKIYYMDQSTPCVIFAFSNQDVANKTWQKIVEAKLFTNSFARSGFSGVNKEAEELPGTLDVLVCNGKVKGEENRFTWGVEAKQGPFGVIVWTKTVENLIKRIFANINMPNIAPRKIDVVKIDSNQLYYTY